MKLNDELTGSPVVESTGNPYYKYVWIPDHLPKALPKFVRSIQYRDWGCDKSIYTVFELHRAIVNSALRARSRAKGQRVRVSKTSSHVSKCARIIDAHVIDAHNCVEMKSFRS